MNNERLMHVFRSFRPLKHGCGFVWCALQSTINILEFLLVYWIQQLVDETSIENLYKTKSTLKVGLLYNKLNEVVKNSISPKLMPVHSFPAFCDVSNLFTCLTFTIKVDSIKPKFKQAIKYLNTNLKWISFCLMASAACLHRESAAVVSYYSSHWSECVNHEMCCVWGFRLWGFEDGF